MKAVIATLAVLLSGSIVLAGGGKVRVEAFTEANEDQQPNWINRALQRSVIDDVSSLPGLELAGADEQADARYIITGVIQRVEGQLRVSGRIEDKSSGKIVGVFKATGAERDLFAMEDAIAEQLRQTFAPTPTTMPAAPVAQPQSPLGPGGAQYTKFDGSELQRALEERDYLRRLAQRQRELLDQPTIPTTPMYPVTVGLGGFPTFSTGWGWGGGWGWNGWCGNIIIRPGCNIVTPNCNGQATRRAASYAGNAPSISTHSMVGGPIMTSGPAPRR